MFDPFSERHSTLVDRTTFSHQSSIIESKCNKMPSIEESESSGETRSTEFSTRDVEVLVQEIKENLRLSGFKSRSGHNRHLKATRPSPYHVPSRSRSWDDAVCDSRRCKQQKTPQTDDPYEMLQELLRDGGLIKEAVRRLEIGITPKQRYLYDSDEECRTPLRVCNVDL